MVPNMTVEIDKPSIVSLESFNKCISENLEALQVNELVENSFCGFFLSRILF
jgi:hypothetical protein